MQVYILHIFKHQRPKASLKRRNSVDVACAECGATIPAGRGAMGNPRPNSHRFHAETLIKSFVIGMLF